jgi:hypothetical protein
MLATWHPLSAKVDINFADKRLSLGIFRSRQAMDYYLDMYVEEN